VVKPVIALVDWYDDWQALYVNGRLVIDDHTVHADSLLDLFENLGIIEVVRTKTWESDGCPWLPEDERAGIGSPPLEFDNRFKEEE
jgi:hypothetical protein